MLSVGFAWLFVASLTEDVARAYTPESPEVVEMVEKALSFLEDADHNDVGGACLIGLAAYKGGLGKEHPKVQQALARCSRAVQELPLGDHIYNEAIAVIFLCEIDPDGHRAEINRFMAEVFRHQKAHGGFGYLSGRPGDTSQTQYAVLAMWSAQRNGFTVPVESMEGVCNWLLQTQDQSGTFTYHPPVFTTQNDPRNDRGQGKYSKTAPGASHSLTAAGLSSVYICADMLGLTPPPADSVEASDLPPGLRRPGEEEEKKPEVNRPRGPLTKKVPRDILRAAMFDGKMWLEDNFTVSPSSWEHYYLYALERYHAFREVADRDADEEPQWYNDGVDRLRSTQGADGSWESNNQTGPACDTAFAVLFLLRSTRMSIHKKTISEAALRGGRGLPEDTSDVRLRGGQVVGVPVARTVNDLIGLLEDAEGTDLDRAIEFPESLLVSGDESTRAQNAARLRAWVSHPSYKVRLAAMQALGRMRDMDNVPVLIYGLTDPDGRVVQAARDGLRFVSRKISGFELPDEPTPEQLEAERSQWKGWYLSIRPDAEFLD
jgi:hypothetical protein